ncbi:MAG: hypothetical protein ACQEXV_09805 [Bacillota bacterium]|uniref:hypothetical protein n=1 Tax=Paenibacillus maysiensis TaxID=1155954 RepID=UPI00046F8020|nr:hypothetical protein [Paenibacillus maysiensis]
MQMVSTFEVIQLLIIIVYLAIIAAGIWGFVLFVKLAHRGIQVMDIYIVEKRNSNKKTTDSFPDGAREEK